MGFLQILSGSGALALIALGVAMIRLDEFKVAYWLFWAAGVTATLAGLWYEMTSLDPALIRVGSGLIGGIAVFVVLPMGFRWLNRITLKAGTKRLDTLPEQ
jgi:hypothetical protein